MPDLTLPETPVAPDVATDGVWLECIECGHQHAPFEEIIYTCPECESLLEARYDSYPAFDEFAGEGVWRYSSALPFDGEAQGASNGGGDSEAQSASSRSSGPRPREEAAGGVSLPEGDTPLHYVPRLEDEIGVRTLRVKHEGMNPTGSFKDRGMTVGVRVAERLGVDRLACASTGNTSAALAAYGARAGLETLVLLPAGKVAAGKVAQASLHGARILEVDGNFDACLDRVQDLADRGEAYLLNSLNPFRLEGQKTIGLEILEAFYADEGRFPDRVVLPVGNAGNTAALYKCFRELVRGGDLAPDEVPTLTGVQAEGAAPMVEAVDSGADDTDRWPDVETIATAIRIGNPVNAPKALPGIRETGGTAVAVSDAEITDAQRTLAGEGVGVEPASAASVAGLRKLRERGEVGDDEDVVCLTTGHLLKDPDAAARAGSDPEPVPNDTDEILVHLGVE
jgi:threonine synthase